MIENRSFGWLLEQAKTLKEWNDKIFWERIPIGDTDDYELLNKLNEKVVSVGLVEQAPSLLMERVRKLGELLENRPCSLKEPYTEMMNIPEVDAFEQYVNDVEEWFKKFEREFEGLSALFCLKEKPALKKEIQDK